jgi:hypothetical protein
MTVYVEDCRIPKRGMLWAHMMADTLPELHLMAQQIGLKRRWFQDKKHPHYDVVDKYRTRAIYDGAKPVKSCLIAMRPKKESPAPRPQSTVTTAKTITNNSSQLISRNGYIKTGSLQKVIDTGEIVELTDITGQVIGMLQNWNAINIDGKIKNYEIKELKQLTEADHERKSEFKLHREKQKAEVATAVGGDTADHSGDSGNIHRSARKRGSGRANYKRRYSQDYADQLKAGNPQRDLWTE